MEFYPTLVVCLVLMSGINFSQACNGYKLTMKKIENCAGPDQIIKIEENSTAEITSDCKVILNGCAHIKAFKTMALTYAVKKNGNRLIGGARDVCQEMEKPKTPDVAAKFAELGIPDKCPINEMDKCVQNLIFDISKFRGMMAIASGNLDVHIEAKHDTGETCIDVSMEIKK